MRTASREIHRVSLATAECRSAGELLRLRLGRLPGVDAVTFGDDGSLLVLGMPSAELRDTVVSTAVAAGFEPRSVSVLPFEPPAPGKPLSHEEAERLGVVAVHKQPVRARTETVQRVSVAVTDGYDPETIIVDAGVPVEIEFSEGHGCLAKVVFDSLGIEADLQDGGATIHIPALPAGRHAFRCGMDMVHGALIVE